MNENACAFVCAIFSLIDFVLFAYSLKTGDSSCWWVTLAFGAVVVMLSGLVIVYRHV